MQRDDDSRRKRPGNRLLVERDDLHPRGAIAVLAQKAAASVVAVVERKIDRENLHLERVARLRTFDVHRAGEDVAAGSLLVAGRLRDDGPARRLNLVWR